MKPRLAIYWSVMCLVLCFSPSGWAAQLAVGEEAPAFALTNQHGKVVRLSDYRGQWVVLYFYPKDDTPGCTTEACSFRDNINRLIQRQAVLIGVSLDDSASHKAFAEKHQLPFNLLSDPDGKVAEQYGSLGDYFLFKLAKRHSFIISPDGKIAKIYRDVDPEDHVAIVLKDLTTLQDDAS